MKLSRDYRVPKMQPYVTALLRERQKDLCADCGDPLFDWQLHHKRYGLDITLDDLELIHATCHAKEHGFNGIKSTVRNFA